MNNQKELTKEYLNDFFQKYGLNQPKFKKLEELDEQSKLFNFNPQTEVKIFPNWNDKLQEINDEKNKSKFAYDHIRRNYLKK